MAFAPLDNLADLNGRGNVLPQQGGYNIVKTGVWFGEHNDYFELLDLRWSQERRSPSPTGHELYNRPNTYSLRHSLWQANVVFPFKGTVAIEGNTVKSGGAIRPGTGYLYPRCY